MEKETLNLYYRSVQKVYPYKVVGKYNDYEIKAKSLKVYHRFKFLHHQTGDAYGYIKIKNGFRNIKLFGTLDGHGGGGISIFNADANWIDKYGERLPKAIDGIVDTINEVFEQYSYFGSRKAEEELPVVYDGKHSYPKVNIIYDR